MSYEKIPSGKVSEEAGVEMKATKPDTSKLSPPKGSWLSFTPPAMPILDYKITRSDLYRRFHGTVIYHIWGAMIYYSVITIIFFSTYMVVSRENCSDDGTSCRPGWFDEHLSSLTMISEKLTVLASFVLTFYLSQAYSRYNDFYWKCRSIQGRINDIALIVGSNIQYNKGGGVHEWASCFERYLNLVHFLVHQPLSPVLRNYNATLYQDVHTSVLVNEEIMGFQLVTPEEFHLLKEAKRLGGPNGPINTVLSWLCMLFDRGASPNEGFFRDNILQARMISLHLTFQENVEELRGAVATLGFERQLPIPVAYAQLMQLFIDVLLHLHPFAIVYEINTVVIDTTGYNEMDRWSTLPFTLLGAMFFVYFYSGLLSLAKSFNSPLGTKSYVDESGHHQLFHKEFYIEVRTIMNQTRSGTYCFFNCSKMAPAVCHETEQAALPPMPPSSRDIEQEEARSPSRTVQRAQSKRSKSSRKMAASRIEGAEEKDSAGDAPGQAKMLS